MFTMFKNKLVLVIILLTQYVIKTVSANEVLQPNENTKTLDDFKNKEYLDRSIMPDITALKNHKDSIANKALQDLLVLWSSLDGEEIEVTNDVPFTIIVPKIDSKTIETERLKEFLLEHLIPGEAFITFNDDDVYGNANKHEILFKNLEKLNESQWTLNNFKILRTDTPTVKLSVIFIDGVLGDRKAVFSKRNIQETNRYNEPQKLEMKNITKEEMLQQPRKDIKLSPLLTFLAGMKTGTKVFQHFLTKSNLTQILNDSPFTVLIPTDNAFQRWHPIDWGFYPFSVQEFTENILRNHFLQMKIPLRMEDVMNMDQAHKYKTLGGEIVIFKNNPTPTVNNVSILADYTLPNGNEVFLISEVLFVSEAIVSRLHQMHKDKETPPLLAFPWFGAQFLSHSFLALERDSRFSQIARFLNIAEVAQFISGANYTFFVPIDDAFKKLKFDILPDDVLASDKGVKMLLCHFVKGRLYDKDLKDYEVFETIGGQPLRIRRLHPGNVTVNRANIIETEIFVYNLGTMFYIDQILYPEILMDSIKPETSTLKIDTKRTTTKYITEVADVEILPSDVTEINDTKDDYDVLQDDEMVTPRALPVKYNKFPTK